LRKEKLKKSPKPPKRKHRKSQSNDTEEIKPVIVHELNIEKDEIIKPEITHQIKIETQPKVELKDKPKHSNSVSQRTVENISPITVEKVLSASTQNQIEPESKSLEGQEPIPQRKERRKHKKSQSKENDVPKPVHTPEEPTEPTTNERGNLIIHSKDKNIPLTTTITTMHIPPTDTVVQTVVEITETKMKIQQDTPSKTIEFSSEPDKTELIDNKIEIPEKPKKPKKKQKKHSESEKITPTPEISIVKTKQDDKLSPQQIPQIETAVFETLPSHESIKIESTKTITQINVKDEPMIEEISVKKPSKKSKHHNNDKHKKVLEPTPKLISETSSLNIVDDIKPKTEETETLPENTVTKTETKTETFDYGQTTKTIVTTTTTTEEIVRPTIEHTITELISTDLERPIVQTEELLFKKPPLVEQLEIVSNDGVSFYNSTLTETESINKSGQEEKNISTTETITTRKLETIKTPNKNGEIIEEHGPNQTLTETIVLQTRPTQDRQKISLITHEEVYREPVVTMSLEFPTITLKVKKNCYGKSRTFDASC